MEKKEKQSPSSKKPLHKSYLRYTGMAFQMVGIILAGLFLGRFIDSRLNNEKHIFTALLSVVFTIVAIYIPIKDLMKKS